MARYGTRNVVHKSKQYVSDCKTRYSFHDEKKKNRKAFAPTDEDRIGLIVSNIIYCIPTPLLVPEYFSLI